MLLTKDMRELAALFGKHDVEYAMVGGLAVVYYGYPRTTQDIDFLINPTVENLPKILNALEDFGFPQSEELRQFFSTTGNALHLGIEPNRIDLLTSIHGIENHLVFQNIVEVTIDGDKLRLISLNDLIESKKSSTRLKDLADAEELEKILKEDQ